MDWKEFHEVSKLRKAGPGESILSEAKGEVKLPPAPEIGLAVSTAIRRRRSRRSLRGEGMTLAELSALLFYSCGVTGEKGGKPLRAAPSAGACHPTELHLVPYSVTGLDVGLYGYDWLKHTLWRHASGNPWRQLVVACLGQEFVGDCMALFVITSKIERTLGRYGQRGYRYAIMDAAAVAENLNLTAEALGYGTVWVGAFDDDAVAAILGLGGDEIPWLLLPVGRYK